MRYSRLLLSGDVSPDCSYGCTSGQNKTMGQELSLKSFSILYMDSKGSCSHPRSTSWEALGNITCIYVAPARDLARTTRNARVDTKPLHLAEILVEAKEASVFQVAAYLKCRMRMGSARENCCDA